MVKKLKVVEESTRVDSYSCPVDDRLFDTIIEDEPLATISPEGVKVTVAYIVKLHNAYMDEKLDLMSTLRKVRGDGVSSDKSWEADCRKDPRPSVVLLFRRYLELCEEIRTLKSTFVNAPSVILNRNVEPFSMDVDD